MGALFLSEESERKNEFAAAQFYSSAAALGDAEAQNNLAVMYDEGIFYLRKKRKRLKKKKT